MMIGRSLGNNLGCFTQIRVRRRFILSIGLSFTGVRFCWNNLRPRIDLPENATTELSANGYQFFTDLFQAFDRV
jgi:hypothetical protein